MTSPSSPAAFAAGRYRVRRLLGEGSRKRVYLADDTRFGRVVALAVLETESRDQEARARVQREARAMGRLGDHPHIVTVHDVGEEDGVPYIVAEYMGGGDLKRLLREAPDRRLPVTEALRIADQVASALEHAHDRGVIHRNLKPGNVWLAADGTAKLGDFGLANMRPHSRLTVEGMIVGTAAYMAPEQALGRPPDPRNDLYALGALLYELVAGRPPFGGDDAVAIVSQHLNAAPVSPSWHNHAVPPALETLILRLLAKAPEDRPPSATAVRAAPTGLPPTRTRSAASQAGSSSDARRS
jgi:eukaryotic-like serine/threonine-protein kinase